MTLDLNAIKARVDRGYIFSQPGEIVVPPFDDIRALLQEIERLTAERDGWQETAAQNQRNTDFYRDLVVAVGRLLGPEVYRCDDGTISQDVLCLKVPEVAARLTADHAALRTVVREWQEARTERRADPIDTRETHDRLRDAEAALAALDLGGAE